jgi:hypothetical protein
LYHDFHSLQVLIKSILVVVLFVGYLGVNMVYPKQDLVVHLHEFFTEAGTL